MRYTRQQILDECSDAMKNVNVFYREDFLKRRGKTADTGEYFTEVMAEFVIANINAFKNIPHITRQESYKADPHGGILPPNSQYSEEDSEKIIAKKMFIQCKETPLNFKSIGNIIDYETPLDNISGDNAGEIDLLSNDGKQLIILELKRPDNEETMLRCVLEGYTYLRRVDKAKLLKDWNYPADYGLSTSPLVYRDGRQWKEMQENRPKLKQLMKLLDITPYCYYLKDGKFIV